MYVCFLVVSWFNLGSFLLLRELYKLQGQINLYFLNPSYIKDWSGKYIHCSWVFYDAWCPNGKFYCIAAGTNRKDETTPSNEMSRTWHKRSETSHFTQSEVMISRTQSNEISRWNETSRCDRCSRWLLIAMISHIVVTHVAVEFATYQLNCSHTLAHCGHKGNRPSRWARWPYQCAKQMLYQTQLSSLLNQKN